MAVGAGFEPAELLHSTIFKTAAFVHSAIPPVSILPENPLIVNVKKMIEFRSFAIILQEIISFVEHGKVLAKGGKTGYNRNRYKDS